MTLRAQGSTVVSERDVEVLENQRDAQQGAVDAARAGVETVDANIAVLLPAQRASAEAALEQAEVELEKMIIYAGTDGRIEQVGDIINPVLRPAGILVPEGSGENRFQAAVPQISVQVIKKGGVAEIMCTSKPFTIVPMVIVEVHVVIAAGQLRPSDRLIDAQSQMLPGSVIAFLERIYPGQTHDIPPGSRCMANVYTSNHARLEEDESPGAMHRVFLHVVDTVGVIHAAGLRIRALLLPLQTLVFAGGPLDALRSR